MPPTLNHPIDASLLMKLRLVVARYGEMDGAGWWNTRGILSRIGKTGLSRGFPTTHYFAQSRVAFAVATARCREVFSPPGCFTLWNLPPDIEEIVESQWQGWCRSASEWEPFFAQISGTNSDDLFDRLVGLQLVDSSVRTKVGSLQRISFGVGIFFEDEVQVIQCSIESVRIDINPTPNVRRGNVVGVLGDRQVDRIVGFEVGSTANIKGSRFCASVELQLGESHGGSGQLFSGHTSRFHNWRTDDVTANIYASRESVRPLWRIAG